MSRGFPSMTALLGLLAVAGFQNRDKITEMLSGLGQGGGVPQPPPQGGAGSALGTGASTSGGLGGILGNLGGRLGGTSIGSVINGGLGDLVDRFRQNGHGATVDSWIDPGPNQQIAPQDLRHAIGPDVLDTLSKQTGLSHDELLTRLSTTLPAAVDSYTPDGRLPS